MADLTLTAAQIAPIYPQNAEIFDYLAAESITKGQAVYFTAAGKVGVADANAAGKQQFRGIALNTAGAGQAVSVLQRGHVYGFAVSSLNADAYAYLSDTVGALADAAGTLTVRAGRVVALPDSAGTKALYIDVKWIDTWA
ncbi:MAG: capsid cement protein [Chloroflexota bacterium]|nr:capsid cement protein [Chloroflexota bacterium]